MKRLLVVTALLMMTIGTTGCGRRWWGGAPWRCGSECSSCSQYGGYSGGVIGGEVGGCSTCNTGVSYDQGTIVGPGETTTPTLVPSTSGQ